ncbi:MAG: branched-chain amino acid aminotransferase [Bacteroidota bacterium]
MEQTIRISPVLNSRVSEVDFDNIPFGREFTDHMFVSDYRDGKWGDFRIEPYGNISISPANMALHYGQAIFEGMKASINEEGVPLLFRPEKHAGRLNKSAVRLGMPEFPEDVFVKALHELLKLDSAWIPTSEGSALYIRPFMFATDEHIGVRPSFSYKMMILALPVGPYYPKPVRILVAQKYVRAVKGGVGFVKAAGNYAATLMPMKIAKSMGFDQILWMSSDFKYVEEAGTMNVFFQIGDKIVTPSTEDGTILEGITRDSFIQILRGKGIEVETRKVTIEELIEAHNSGILKDVFGAGTAAVVATVSEIKYRDILMTLPDPSNRPISQMLKKELNGIRNGSIADKFDWVQPVMLEKVV